MDNASILRAALAAVKDRPLAARFHTFDRPKSEKESGAQKRKRLRVPGKWTPHAPVLRGRP